MDFQVSVQPTSPVLQSFRAQFSRTVYNDEYGRVLRRTATKVALKGFRPGKAPLTIVEKSYGQQIRADVLDDFFRTAYEKAVAENKLQVVGVGGVHFHDGCEHHSHEEGKAVEHEHTDDIVITAEISIMPEPEIKTFKNLKYSVGVVTPSDKMVDEAVEQVRQSTAKVEPVQGRDVAQKGDLTTISFTLSVNGKAVPTRKGQDRHWETNVLGEGKFAPELEDKIVGMKLEEEKTIAFTRESKPEEGKEAEGETSREVEYQIKLEKIATKTLLPIDDELAKQSGFAESLDEMRKQLREALESRVKKENENRHTTSILKELVNNNSFDVPQVMIDDEIRQMLFEYRVLDASKRESYRVDVTPFRKELGGEGEFRVRRSIVLQQIAKQENIKPTDDEVEKWLDGQAEEQGVPRERINQFYAYPDEFERVRTIVSFQNALKLVRESAQATETELSSDSNTSEQAA